MHNLDLILTIAGGLAAALICGYGTHRLGVSPIVGYLIAGIVVGPSTPGFVASKELASQLAEIGVILLMFGVGLHFHLEDLLRVRRVALPGALVQSAVATLLGWVVGIQLGWSSSAGLVFGLAVSVASTVVLLRVLSDNNDLHTPKGHIAVGWLIVEDLFTVLVLVLLSVLYRPDSGGGGNILLALLWAILKVGFLVGFIFLAGSRALPWLLARAAETRSRELFTLTILVVALGIAVGAALLFDVSMALGAFLAGMVVGRSEFSSRAASEALPMRDAFAVLFFVSVGMLLDPAFLIESPGIVLMTLGIILLGKPLAALAIVLFLGYPLRTALAVAMALAQIGEFSFILASLGTDLDILPPEATSALIAAAIVSIGVNPILYRLIRPLEKRLEGIAWLRGWISRRQLKLPAIVTDTGGSGMDSAIVVGHGPVGRTAARLLRENGLDPVVIELNLETVHLLRKEGARAVYGDAAHSETLKEAGVERASALILSSSGLERTTEIIRAARAANPMIRVFVRASYLSEVEELRAAGADAVFAAEGELALAMTEYLLRQLGATAEQLDRERERVRAEVLAGSRPDGIVPGWERPRRRPRVAAGDGEKEPAGDNPGA